MSVENAGNTRLLGHHEQLFYAYNKGNNSDLYVSINIIQSKEREITIKRVRDAFRKVSRMNFMMHACVKVDSADDCPTTPRFYPMNENKLAEADQKLFVKGFVWQQRLNVGGSTPKLSNSGLKSARRH